jgi:DNA-binding NarL/FixJ family response regulator
MKRIRIVMADDHTAVRQGIAALLATVPDFEIVGQAEDGEQAVARVKELSPDVIILDLEMPRMSGTEAATVIRYAYPKTRVLIFSGFENEKYVTEILKSGAAGYVIKGATREELIEAIRTVAQGDHFFCPSVSRIMVHGLLKKHDGELKRFNRPREPLTELEMQILSLLTQGLTMAQTGERLAMNGKTVERHFNALKKKLDIHDIMNLVEFAKEFGFLSKTL